jgi:hypothetical protein
VPEEPLSEERWAFERSMREREMALEERRLENEIQSGGKREGWGNPLVVAVFAAAVAAAGNAVVTYVQGVQDRQLEAFQAQQTNALEERRAEFARIQQMLETGDPDTGAANLQFLMDVGLISDPVLQAGLRDYLTNRTPGSGVSLHPLAAQVAHFSLSPEMPLVIAKFGLMPEQVAVLSEVQLRLSLNGRCPNLSGHPLQVAIPQALSCIGGLIDATPEEVLSAVRLQPELFLSWIQTGALPQDLRDLIGLVREQ